MKSSMSLIIAFLTTALLASAYQEQQDGQHAMLLSRSQELQAADYLARRGFGLEPDLDYANHALFRRGPVRKAGTSKAEALKAVPSSSSSGGGLSRMRSQSLPSLSREYQIGSPRASPGSLRRTDGWMAHGNVPMDQQNPRLQSAKLPGRLNANPLGVARAGISKKSGSSTVAKSLARAGFDTSTSPLRVTGGSSLKMPDSPFAQKQSSSRQLTRVTKSLFDSSPSLSPKRIEKMDSSSNEGSGELKGGSSLSLQTSGSSFGKPPLPPKPLASAATNLADQMGRMTTQDRGGPDAM